jgi:hypothetical protein
MATPPNPNPNPSPISPLKAIGNVRRPELEREALGGYRTTSANPYSKTHPLFFNTDGINGDNDGKEPPQPPVSYDEAVKTVGSAADIKARIGAGSPGTLAQNRYKPGNEYKVDF